MREYALSRIEQDLAVTLPRRYRELMLAYPFAADSWAGDLAMPDDPDLLLEMNREHRELPADITADVFFIGSDGRGTDYFVRLSDPWCGVASYDTATHKTVELTKSFDEWLSRLRSADEAPPRPDRRRWWEIWK